MFARILCLTTVTTIVAILVAGDFAAAGGTTSSNTGGAVSPKPVVQPVTPAPTKTTYSNHGSVQNVSPPLPLSYGSSTYGTTPPGQQQVTRPPQQQITQPKPPQTQPATTAFGPATQPGSRLLVQSAQFVRPPVAPPAPVVANPPPAVADPAASSLATAQLYIDNGLKDKAKELLADIVKTYPNTAVAKDAQAKLAELGG